MNKEMEEVACPYCGHVASLHVGPAGKCTYKEQILDLEAGEMIENVCGCMWFEGAEPDERAND